MKKERLLAGLICTGMFLTGCADSVSEETVSSMEDSAAVTVTESSLTLETTEVVAETEDDFFDFTVLTGYEFEVGNTTRIYIDDDGNFIGYYCNSSILGLEEEGTAVYTEYECIFNGAFTTPTRQDDNTYIMSVASIEYLNSAGSSSSFEDVTRVYTEPEGIRAGDDFYIYLPTTPTDELPVTYTNLIQNSAEQNLTEIGTYGLYNLTETKGFMPNVYEKTDYHTVWFDISGTETMARYYEAIINSSDNQEEINEASYNLYMLWDEQLNALFWDTLPQFVDTDYMTVLNEEEIAWIVYKEAEIEAAGENCPYDYMRDMVSNLRAAELTRVQLYKLLEYLIYY